MGFGRAGPRQSPVLDTLVGYTGIGGSQGTDLLEYLFVLGIAHGVSHAGGQLAQYFPIGLVQTRRGYCLADPLAASLGIAESPGFLGERGTRQNYVSKL